MTRITVSLDDVRIFAYHGLHPEERTAGAEFRVDLQVEYVVEERINDIDHTVDYTRLYSIVKAFMQKPYALLETLCVDISDQIKMEFKQVKGINITIRKLNPPVVNLRGQLGVNVNKQFE